MLCRAAETSGVHQRFERGEESRGSVACSATVVMMSRSISTHLSRCGGVGSRCMHSHCGCVDVKSERRVSAKLSQSVHDQLRRDCGVAVVGLGIVVVTSKRITSWLEPVAWASSTAQFVASHTIFGDARVRSSMDVPWPFLYRYVGSSGTFSRCQPCSSISSASSSARRGVVTREFQSTWCAFRSPVIMHLGGKVRGVRARWIVYVWQSGWCSL
jgi:hypothetical protein